MFSWWSELPAWLRYGVALLLLGISTVLYFSGVIWIWGWVAGTILLLIAGPSSTEKKGYRF